MSTIQLFRLQNGVAAEIKGEASDLEKPLQTLIEKNLEPLLGIRFVASEFVTKNPAGRIDTLGLDENLCPVIVEYKRSSSENVINQGLFYLDWLMDHQAEFKLLVLDQFGKDVANAIEWASPRLVCIAANFTKYDDHAVNQMNRNIDLVRYRMFGSDLLLLESATSVVKTAKKAFGGTSTEPTGEQGTEDHEAWWSTFFASMTPQARELYESIDGFITSLGDDVQRKFLKQYIAYKRLRNFATAQVYKNGRVLLYVHLNPDEVEFDSTWMMDGRTKGHWGTGDLGLDVTTNEHFQAAKDLILRAYEVQS
jgi:predicted transport protein